MSAPSLYQSLRDSPTKLRLLRVLWWFTAHGNYPTASELAKAIDDRNSIPRATIHVRRNMLSEFRNAGLAQAVEMPDSKFTHLAITPEGIALIKKLDRERAE